MKINFTKTQYKELLELIMLGSHVKESVLELRGQDWRKARVIANFLFSHAHDFGLDSIVERYKDDVVPTNDFCLKIEEMEEAYNDDEFWFTLSNKLGQRDFYENLSKEEKEKLESGDGWLPESIHTFYEKYENEFEKNGIDNLRISINSPINRK